MPLWHGDCVRCVCFVCKCAHAQYSHLIFTSSFHLFPIFGQLNREIAQNVYNKAYADENDGQATIASGGAGVDDSSQSLGIDTKRDLLYKIHIKNKYIKRLLCEHGALIETNSRQRDEILMLNVSLKQSAHKLAETLAELIEQKKQNRMYAEDIARSHKKIIDVRRQMARIEQDKRQYKNDIVCLGDEIQKKIDQWNGMLQSKYSNISEADVDSERTHRTEAAVTPIENDYAVDNSRLEIEALSKAVKKRNAIIAEMEVLLTGLTNEISSSAIVINRIVKNLSQREINFADNLEKLHKHLDRIVTKPPSDSGDSGQKKSKKSKVKRSSNDASDDKGTKSRMKGKIKNATK